jgi:hypothetical protein
MNFIVKLLIVFFIAFLSAPTVVSLIEKKVNISFCYDNSEKEDFQKELKTEFILETLTYIVFNSQKKLCKILSDNLSKHDNISKKIVIPPPDII